MIYADTSALAAAYLADEVTFHQMRRLLLESTERVITSEISRIEFAGATVRAARAGRIRRSKDFIDSFERDCGPGAAIALVPLVREPILAEAHRISAASGLSALDAIHVAVALAEAGRSPVPDGSEFRFVTRDAAQAAAARAEGLVVA